MRGFRSRATVAAAVAWLQAHAELLPAETVPLVGAAARVLAADIVSSRDVPSFRRAMMDGFAVQASDTFGATTYDPLPLRIVGEVLPVSDPRQAVNRGEAVRIMTGAPIPAGADAVIPAEKTTTEADQVWVLDEVPPEKHIGSVGEDIQQGDVVLRQGRRLRPQDLGVLSSLGQAHASVVRRPRVRLIVTGNELCGAGTVPGTHQTADANSPMLRALIERDGGTVQFDGITPDEPQAIRDAMMDAQADVVIVSGGSSVGQEDHAPRLLAELGNLAIHGVAMRPSSPTGMGTIAARPVFLLPGNPVSCLCAYDFFARQAVCLRGGQSVAWPYRRCTGTLNRKISSIVGRQDYARVRVVETAIEPIAIGGASVLSSASRADGFVIVPADSEGFAAGSDVEVWLYE